MKVGAQILNAAPREMWRVTSKAIAGVMVLNPPFCRNENV